MIVMTSRDKNELAICRPVPFLLQRLSAQQTTPVDVSNNAQIPVDVHPANVPYVDTLCCLLIYILSIVRVCTYIQYL